VTVKHQTLIQNNQNQDKILPANYLNTDNVARYRTIMSFFYKKHTQMQGTLYRPEILSMMQEHFPLEYDEAKLDSDLESLVTWQNLQKQQEIIRPKSIEEYRNRNFRYQISEEGIFVEEMVHKLIHSRHEAQGALDEKGFRKLLYLLEQFVYEEAKNTEVWLELREQFQSIRQDTSNYIGYITSPDVDSRMKTELFLVYKDKFVNYLRDFISSVQGLYHQFVSLLSHIEAFDFSLLIQQLYQREMERPTFDEMSFQEVEEQTLAEIQALKQWFIDRPDRPSEYTTLTKQTDQMISKITGLVYYFTQEMRQYQSRRKDYIHMASWFHEVENIKEAHKMYGAIFGLEHSRHYYVPSPSVATSTREDSWQLEPSILMLDERVAGVRQDAKVQTVVISKERQQKQREDYLVAETKARQRIDSYFVHNCIDFHEISMLDPVSRKVFLKWISQAIQSMDPNQKQMNSQIQEQISTQMDYSVVVRIDKSKMITVKCEDGTLTMPYVLIERMEHETR